MVFAALSIALVAIEVPDIEEKSFIISQQEEVRNFIMPQRQGDKMPQANPESEAAPLKPVAEDFDLSDISAKPKQMSKEEIIAAAEAEAYQD